MAAITREFSQGSYQNFALYAEQLFGASTSKTANVLLRYQSERIACVIDSRYSGQTVREVNPAIPSDVPLVASVEEALGYHPTDMVIGVAPAGGQLPEEWYEPVSTAIQNNLNIISGLHSFLSDVPDFVELAEKHDVNLVDLRKPPELHAISAGKWRDRTTPVILSIAPDCATGKLTASWELKRQLEKRGFKVGFVATGQTGIMLNGRGIVIDAMKGDFISAAVEQMIEDELKFDPDVVLIEGQGSIYHEGFSAVTFGLLHGAMPDSFLFVHRPGKHANDYGFQFPPFRQMMNDYESLVEWFKPCHTCGVQLDTSKYDDEEAHAICDHMQEITGLPSTDLVRFPDDNMIEMMVQKLKMYEGTNL